MPRALHLTASGPERPAVLTLLLLLLLACLLYICCRPAASAWKRRQNMPISALAAAPEAAPSAQVPVRCLPAHPSWCIICTFLPARPPACVLPAACLQVAASGAAFILTGNLAAPLAGNLVSQMLFCTYQRIGLKRSLEVRAAACVFVHVYMHLRMGCVHAWMRTWCMACMHEVAAPVRKGGGGWR